MDANKQFKNAMFSDECRIQLDVATRMVIIIFATYEKKRALKQWAKQSVKVHIWGGVSMRGANEIVIFTGTMDVIKFGKILEVSLVSFVLVCYPDGHT